MKQIISQRPNRRTLHADTETLGLFLANVVARHVQEAIEVLDERLRMLDGHGSGGGNDGQPRGGVSRPAERVALERYELIAEREQLRDDGRAAVSIIRSYDAVALRILKREGATEPDAPILCRDGQHGKNLPTSVDPGCTGRPHKSGLCDKDYMAWWRYRRSLGITIEEDVA